MIIPNLLVFAKSQSFEFIPINMIDGNVNTYWKSIGLKDQSVTIDFKTKREFGGLKIDWLKDFQARSFEILLSDDGKIWEKVYSVNYNLSQLQFY